jgi:uncharacterized protein YwgA
MLYRWSDKAPSTGVQVHDVSSFFMNREQVALGLTLKAAEIPISVDSFHERLTVQKAVYLLEQAGLDLGYPFNWYIRGPYSSPLAGDLYALVDAGTSELARYKLTHLTREKIRKVSALWANKSDAKVGRARWLELLASVLFLIRTRQSDAADSASLSDILRKNQKYFSPKEAVHELRETGVFEFLSAH